MNDIKTQEQKAESIVSKVFEHYYIFRAEEIRDKFYIIIENTQDTTISQINDMCDELHSNFIVKETLISQHSIFIMIEY